MVTMLLGGLWHGAGWTFVIWGGLHGIYLVVNHGWRAFRGRYLPGVNADSRIYRVLAVALTFVCVVVGWVFFRASSLDSALQILAGMGGLHGATLPDALGRVLGPARGWVEAVGMSFVPGGGARFVSAWSWILLLGLIAFFWPNTQTLIRRFEPTLGTGAPAISATLPERLARLAWYPSRAWAFVIGLVTAAGLLSLNRVSEFLYFQF